MAFSRESAVERAFYQPEPPPPPPPPPPDEPLDEPLPPLEAGEDDADAMVFDRSSPRWLAKATGSLIKRRSPSYQVATAAAAPAVASTPAKRLAQAFCTSSAMA